MHYVPKVYRLLTITSICEPSLNCCHKGGGSELSRLFTFYASALNFFSLDPRGPNPLHDDDAKPHKDVMCYGSLEEL